MTDRKESLMKLVSIQMRLNAAWDSHAKSFMEIGQCALEVSKIISELSEGEP